MRTVEPLLTGCLIACCGLSSPARSSDLEVPHSAVVKAVDADPFRVDLRGGKLLRFREFDLTRPGAKWSGNGTIEMVYEEGSSFGCYRMHCRKKGFWTAASSRQIPLKLNGSYILSLLVNCDFDEENEVNVGIRQCGMVEGKPKSFLFNLNGIPAKTRGWVRWEYKFCSYCTLEGLDDRGHPVTAEALTGQFYFRPFSRKGEKDPAAAKEFSFRIADVALIELPPEPLHPFQPGEGVTFRGGPGELPMRVEDAQSSDSLVSVKTTGTEYRFHTASGKIEAYQRLEKERAVATWQSSLPLRGLQITKRSDGECVLVCPSMTIGIQCDGMMVIAPHRLLILTCTGQIGGRWNRFAAGHLYSVDEWGGMTVNPHVPLGTQRTSRYRPAQPDLSQPGWRIQWAVASGERVGICVLPPRPFDWKQSFNFAYTLVYPGLRESYYRQWAKCLDTVLLWNSFWRCSWSPGTREPEYVPLDEADLTKSVRIAKESGLKTTLYMSPYFYCTHDPAPFIKELRRLRDAYGVDGVYFDGDQSQDWIQAYEVMRMTRACYPRGVVILHTTGQTYNGGPPLARPDLFIPAIDTYATATLRGEFVLGEGSDWEYPKYVSSQYRRANCIGIQKGDRWDIPQIEQDLINLFYNGRARGTSFYNPRPNTQNEFTEIYWPIKMKLKTLWEEKGTHPGFYEQHYLPRVKELTQPFLPQR